MFFHGQAKIEVSGRRLSCVPGDMIILSPGSPRRLSEVSCGVSWMKAGGPWLKRLMDRSRPPLDRLINLDDKAAVIGHFANLYGYLFLHEQPHGQALRNMLQNWVVDLHRLQDGRRRSIVTPMLSELKDHMHSFYDQPWDLGLMAKMTGLSTSTLISRFREAYGNTPMQHLIRVRMLHAAGLIIYGDHSVSEAAGDVGYESGYCFTRNFKKHIGLCPGALRRKQSDLDDELLLSVNLERVVMMARQGMSDGRIARETGFADVQTMRSSLLSALGFSTDGIRRKWSRRNPPQLPQILRPVAGIPVRRFPGLVMYNLGWRYLHDAGIEDHDAVGCGLLFMVFHDEVQVQVRGRMLPCPAGSLVIFTPDSRRMYGQPQRPWRSSWLWADGPWFEQQISSLGLPLNQIVRLSAPGADMQDFLSLREELLYQGRPEGMMVRNLLQNWLRELKRGLEEGRLEPLPETLPGVKLYMQRHSREDLSLKLLAGMACYSEDYFGRLFKSAFGLSPVKYLTRLRMLQAFTLLRHGDLEVRQAARETGYADPELFADHFRLYFGIKPSELLQAERHKPGADTL